MDPQQKKVALRAIDYGLHVLTSADGEELSAAGVRDESATPLLLRSTGMNDGG